MVLDKEFKDYAHNFIKKNLEDYIRFRSLPPVSSTWNCENMKDFMRGFLVGHWLGRLFSAFEEKYGRMPNVVECDEIAWEIDLYAKVLKNYIGMSNL